MMKIPIEKERLYKILKDLDHRHGILAGPTCYTYAYVFEDDEAIQVLADMGFVELKSGGLVLSRIDELKKMDGTYESVGVHLRNEFLTQVGLALFREEES